MGTHCALGGSIIHSDHIQMLFPSPSKNCVHALDDCFIDYYFKVKPFNVDEFINSLDQSGPQLTSRQIIALVF